MPAIKILVLTTVFLHLWATGSGQCNTKVPNPPKVSVLIIGENTYAEQPLENSVNDAVDIAGTMNSMRFTVKLDTNTNLEKMRNDIDLWTNSLTKDVDVAILYFAGHGAEISGENYLYPISANPDERNENIIINTTYAAATLLDKMETRNKKLNIVILDACRDDPTRGILNSPVRRGLANMQKIDRGVLVAFPVAAGKKTLDGTGRRNSTYASALLESLELPNLSITALFAKIHEKVALQSKYGDTPFINSSISSQNDICLCCVPVDPNASLAVRHGDTVFTESFKRYREKSKPDTTSVRTNYNLMVEIFGKAHNVIERSVVSIYDSIKGACACQLAHPGESKEITAGRFTSRFGFANDPLGDDLFYPTIIGEIKDNEFYFTIFGQTYTFLKLEAFEKEHGLNNKTVLSYPKRHIDWEEIAGTIREYLRQRLDLMVRQN